MRATLRRGVFLVCGVLTLLSVYIYLYRLRGAVVRRRRMRTAALEDPPGVVSAEQACVLPRQRVWPPQVRQVYRAPAAPLSCLKQEPRWVYVQNGTFRIRSDMVKKHGGRIDCKYLPKLRADGSDFTVVEGEYIDPMKDGMKVTGDQFNAYCAGADGKTYAMAHSAVRYEPELHARHRQNPLPADSLGLDVMMFGFDSTSRMSWMRNLPRAHKFFTEKLRGVVMGGYNIVGDGTPQALLPILTGKTELELPEARRGKPGARPVDGHPWIWKELKRAGYVTQWGEDGAGFGTFTYRMMGFEDPPVDHYMRPFYLVAEPLMQYHPRHCLGSMPLHRNMMNMARDFFRMYKHRNKRKFSFLFHSAFSHDTLTDLRYADDDLERLLKVMEMRGHLNNTLLILMADHGARFSSVRGTVQGKYEERNPYLGLRVPPWFRDKHPDIVASLRANAGRLTTPFDLHATFHDILHYDRDRQASISDRGISLFKEVPPERTCAHAHIEPHWCNCMSWRAVGVGSAPVRRAAQALVTTINRLTAERRDQCAPLRLLNVTSAVMYQANDHVLRFKQSKDTDGRVPDLSDTMTAPELYQLVLFTAPNQGHYEVTVQRNRKSDTYDVSERQISRINRYGNAPHCVMAALPHLRPYCYCKDLLVN